MARSTHPVAEVLRARRASGSRPGARDDPHRVALILEGGGMRGVVSCGMTAGLDRLGLTPALDFVVGSSAGALNGAGLLGGVAAAGVGTYCGPLASRRFINPARMLVGRPAIDVRYILTDATADLDPDRHQRTIASPAPLLCVATDVERAAPVTFRGMATEQELWDVLLATARMPWIGGPPVVIDGRRYIDGALVASLPLQAALDAGATHVLALQTRPYGVPRTTGSRTADRFIERHLRGLNPDLVALWRRRVPDYEALMQDIARRTLEPGETEPHVLGLRPRAGTPVVGQLERRPDVLRAAATAAQALVEDALGDPALAPTPMTLETVTLGRDGPPATRLGLGLAALGRPAYITLGHAADLGPDRSVAALRAHCHEVLDAAYAAGVRYVDAARSYGLAEEFVATWAAPGQVTIGSKWGYTYTGDWRLDAEVHEVKDLSAATLRRQLAETRALLGDRLALYQIHSATLESGVLDDAEVGAELAALRASGVAVGLTVTGPGQAATIDAAVATGAFDTVQATWNLHEPSAGPALGRAHDAGLGVLVKESVANGRLAGDAAPAVLRQAAAERGTTPDALAIAVALAQPWASVVLSGAATVPMLRSNLAAADVPVDEDLLERLAPLAEPPADYWAARGALAWT